MKFVIYCRGYPPSKEQVEQWYDYRAHEIEGLSRHVDHALELIRLALERRFEVCCSVKRMHSLSV